jgi:CBS domain-containing protein
VWQPACRKHRLSNWREIVVLEEGNALGVVGQDELIRAYATGAYQGLTAEEIMREGVPQVPPEIPLTAAAQVMLDRGGRALFLMHHAAGMEYPAAIVTYRHFLRHMAAKDAAELRDLGILAERQKINGLEVCEKSRLAHLRPKVVRVHERLPWVEKKPCLSCILKAKRQTGLLSLWKSEIIDRMIGLHC